jgi:antirestriction protein ArdC
MLPFAISRRKAMSIKIYEMISERIMEMLQQDIVPWKKSWNAQTNYPKNLISKKPYKGVNVFMLACQQYDSPWWLTYKQATDLGGHVKRGMKSTPVIFWKWLDRIGVADADSENHSNGKIPLLRFYQVFHVSQTEGITIPEPEETHNHFDPIAKAEELITNMPLRPDIRHGGNRAYYSVALDYIQLPFLHTFDSPEEYACVKFHECIHAVGSEKRLNRKSLTEISGFGSHEYSKEELVAEMGAAFLCGMSGIEQVTIENSAAYIRGWLKALKNDKTMCVMAAAQGQKAADYIINKQEDHIELDEAA